MFVLVCFIIIFLLYHFPVIRDHNINLLTVTLVYPVAASGTNKAGVAAHHDQYQYTDPSLLSRARKVHYVPSVPSRIQATFHLIFKLDLCICFSFSRKSKYYIFQSMVHNYRILICRRIGCN